MLATLLLSMLLTGCKNGIGADRIQCVAEFIQAIERNDTSYCMESTYWPGYHPADDSSQLYHNMNVIRQYMNGGNLYERVHWTIADDLSVQGYPMTNVIIPLKGTKNITSIVFTFDAGMHAPGCKILRITFDSPDMHPK